MSCEGGENCIDTSGLLSNSIWAASHEKVPKCHCHSSGHAHPSFGMTTTQDSGSLQHSNITHFCLLQLRDAKACHVREANIVLTRPGCSVTRRLNTVSMNR